MTPLSFSLGVTLAATIATGLSPTASPSSPQASTSTKASMEAHAQPFVPTPGGLPPLELPASALARGARLETRPNPWELRSVGVERLLKKGLCPALLEDARLGVDTLFTDSVMAALPGAGKALTATAGGAASPPKDNALRAERFKQFAPGLWLRTLKASAETSLNQSQVGQGLERWLRPFVLRKRCSVGFHVILVSRGWPSEGRGRLHLLMGGYDALGRPLQDSGEVSFDYIQERHQEPKLTRLVFGPRRRVYAARHRYVERTLASGLARNFKEPYWRFAEDEPDRSALALADIDHDGDLDLYVGRTGPNLLYLNDGHGHFKEAARALGVAERGNARGALFVDLDADGDEDLVLTNSIWRRHQGAVIVYENQSPPAGSGDSLPAHTKRFRERYRFVRGKQNAYRSVVAADVDGDGDLDLFVANYGSHGSDLRKARSMLDDKSGLPDRLLINLGDFHFEDRAKAWGVQGDGWTLAAALVDLDEDGRPELLAADDFGSKRLYRNVEGKRFEDRSAASGVGIEQANGMGVDVADFDGDGSLDIYFANMYSNAGSRLAHFLPPEGPVRERIRRATAGNTLWLARGPLVYEEASERMAVNDGGWAWSGRFIDLDHYGAPEIISPCGFVTSADQEDG